MDRTRDRSNRCEEWRDRFEILRTIVRLICRRLERVHVGGGGRPIGCGGQRRDRRRVGAARLVRGRWRWRRSRLAASYRPCVRRGTTRQGARLSPHLVACAQSAPRCSTAMGGRKLSAGVRGAAKGAGFPGVSASIAYVFHAWGSRAGGGWDPSSPDPPVVISRDRIPQRRSGGSSGRGWLTISCCMEVEDDNSTTGSVRCLRLDRCPTSSPTPSRSLGE